MGPRASRRASLVLVGVTAACGTRFAQTAEEPLPRVEAGAYVEASVETGIPAETGAPDEAAAAPCGTLADRITTTTVDVMQDIRYKRAGYNGIPEDERIGFAVEPGGTGAVVAWLDNAVTNVTATNVHVTPLTASMTRRAADTSVSGIDIGGIIAQSDGFVLLTQRDDPQPLIDPNADPMRVTHAARAVFLLRFVNGVEAVSAALTGLTSIVTGQADDHRRDCAPTSWLRTPLNGRLEFNGTAYGAYFAVHGCTGHFEQSLYGDKLLYADNQGRYLSGGFDWGCGESRGMRLLPEPTTVFTSLCMSTGAPYPGLNLFVAGRAPAQLGGELGFPGYCAGQFGSAVKMGDGSYVVAWLSRGVAAAGAAKPAPDIALLHLAPDYTPIGTMHWAMETPMVAESNLHLAPYGPDRLLLAWDTFENLLFDTDMSGTSRGTYTGTHLRLIDANGTALTTDETIGDPPNGSEDIAVFSNRDLGWAFVPEDDRSNVTKYPGAIDAAPPVSAKRRIAIAHLRYCAQ